MFLICSNKNNIQEVTRQIQRKSHLIVFPVLKQSFSMLAPYNLDLHLRIIELLFLENKTKSRGTQRICSSHYLFPTGILLAGKNRGVSMSWLGNFVIDRGFAWELLTFSSISTRAGCRNSED